MKLCFHKIAKEVLHIWYYAFFRFMILFKLLYNFKFYLHTLLLLKRSYVSTYSFWCFVWVCMLKIERKICYKAQNYWNEMKYCVSFSILIDMYGNIHDFNYANNRNVKISSLLFLIFSKNQIKDFFSRTSVGVV